MLVCGLRLQPPKLSFIDQRATAIGMKLQSDAAKEALTFAVRLPRFRRKVIVSLGCVWRKFRGRRIIFGRGFGRWCFWPAKCCVSPVGRAPLRTAFDNFVSRNLFAQSAMVRKDLPELSMIPQIKRRSVYLVITGDLTLQASDGAAGTTETSCVRAPDRPVIDFNQHRVEEDCFG